MFYLKKLARFLVSVKQEMKKVKWPSKKEMIVYSTATLMFILIFALFFTGTDVILAFLQSLVK